MRNGDIFATDKPETVVDDAPLEAGVTGRGVLLIELVAQVGEEDGTLPKDLDVRRESVAAIGGEFRGASRTYTTAEPVNRIIGGNVAYARLGGAGDRAAKESRKYDTREAML